MERDEIEEVLLPPSPVGAAAAAAAAAAEGVHAAPGAGDEAVDPPPQPPPALEPAAVVDEHPRVAVPGPAAAAARWYEDRLTSGLLMLTGVILVFLFIIDKGANPMAWWAQLAGMTATQWWTALFLGVGDLASLVLIFSPSPFFQRMWTEEGAAGLPVLVPPLAGFINCAVWLAYGVVVKGMNASVMVVNGTGVVFNLVYAIIFLLRSGTRRLHTLAGIVVAIMILAVIAVVDHYIFINAWGWELPIAVGRSGAVTGALMYGFGAYGAMMAAKDNRGADGFSAQAVASFLNALVWFGYACFQEDHSMQFANGFGIICFLLQVGQLAFFHFNKTPEAQGEEAQRLLEA